jgi:hypothetical protein
VQHFISTLYPFEDDRCREKLLEEYINSEQLQELAKYPILLVMLCGLFDDPILGSYLNEAIDIYSAVVALLFKTEQLKDASMNAKERQEWHRLQSGQIIEKYRDSIVALGIAILALNGALGNAIFVIASYDKAMPSSYDDLPEVDLRKIVRNFTCHDESKVILVTKPGRSAARNSHLTDRPGEECMRDLSEA